MTAPEQFSRGPDVFIRASGTANPDQRAILERYVDWAQRDLSGPGLADLWTMTGVAHRHELQARIPGHSASLVKAWIEGGIASLQIHTSVWDRWAPRSRDLLESQGIAFDGEWFGVYDWHERHLAVMVLAYHEAAGSDDFGERFDRLVRDLPAMSTRYRPDGVVSEGDVVEVVDGDGDIGRYVVAPSSLGPVEADVRAVCRQAPLGRALLGACTGETVSRQNELLEELVGRTTPL